jgi:hypothetical protein
MTLRIFTLFVACSQLSLAATAPSAATPYAGQENRANEQNALYARLRGYGASEHEHHEHGTHEH